MNPTGSNPETPKKQNVKLSWTRYEWEAVSSGKVVVGAVVFINRPTLSELNHEVNRRLATFLTEQNESWDPFNCRLIIRGLL